MFSWRCAVAFSIARLRQAIGGLALGSLCLLTLAAHAEQADLETSLDRLEQLAGHQPAQAQRELDSFVQGQSGLEERAQLRVELIRILIADSQYRVDDVLALADRIRDRMQVLADARMQALLERARAGAFCELGRFDECAKALEDEGRHANRSGDPDLAALSIVDGARLHIRRGEFEPAAAAIADAEQRVRGPQASAEVAFANALLARAICDWPLALNSYQAAYAKFKAVGDSTGQADALAGSGEALRQMGRYSEALDPLAEAVVTYQEVADKDGAALAMLQQALTFSALHDSERALETNARALDALAQLNEPLQLAKARVERAQLLVGKRQPGDALALIELARPAIFQLGDPKAQTDLHEAAASAMAALGQHRAAYDEMLLFRETNRRWTEQLVERQLAAQRGRLESERLSRENALLRTQASSSAQALSEANRASQLEVLGLVLGALIVVGALFAIWRQRTLMQHIARMAETDSLTGVLNRRHVLELGQRTMNRCRRDRRPCAILMLDIDRFKEINDRYGHTAGDRALCAISDALSRCLRPGDHLGRYGGEEFAVILPGADAQEAGIVAERLRQAVAQLKPNWAAGAEPLTVSGGIAIAGSDIVDFTQLVDHADRALYRAKNAGRNRMEYDSAHPELAPG